MWHKQVLEVTLEGQQSVREVHLQDEGFGPMEETGVQVIMMGHTTLTCQRHSAQSSETLLKLVVPTLVIS